MFVPGPVYGIHTSLNAHEVVILEDMLHEQVVAVVILGDKNSKLFSVDPAQSRPLSLCQPVEGGKPVPHFDLAGQPCPECGTDARLRRKPDFPAGRLDDSP